MNSNTSIAPMPAKVLLAVRYLWGSVIIETHLQPKIVYKNITLRVISRGV